MARLSAAIVGNARNDVPLAGNLAGDGYDEDGEHELSLHVVYS
jgi:hypothetical protein